MTIRELTFCGFRNLKDSCIQPSEGMNIIYGDNAQGKTNLLECIWMFNGVRSFRGSKDSELVSFQKKSATVSVTFFAEQRMQTAQIQILQNKREAVLNGVKKNSTAELIGKCTSVVFSPEHLTLVKNGPSERRRFIDGALCRLKPRYAVLFTGYHRVLNQRNALLKDIPRHRELSETLSIWDEKLAQIGASLLYERFSYINLLREKARAFHTGISERKEDLSLIYQSGCKIQPDDSSAQMQEKLTQSLVLSRKEDIYTGCTNYGPHRDDIEILINGIKARNFASQGQQRSAVLSLKLAEAAVLKEKMQENPIILLDDVLSELDLSRQTYLLNELQGWQVFITCCDRSAVQSLRGGCVFHVSEGEIQNITEYNR